MADQGTCVTSLVYKTKGNIPSVFVAGTWSNPTWVAYKMEYRGLVNGEHYYALQITVRDGDTIFYKFVLGEGEQQEWIVDDTQETAIDDHGNKNNVMHVPSWDHLNIDFEDFNGAALLAEIDAERADAAFGDRDEVADHELAQIRGVGEIIRGRAIPNLAADGNNGAATLAPPHENFDGTNIAADGNYGNDGDEDAAEDAAENAAENAAEDVAEDGAHDRTDTLTFAYERLGDTNIAAAGDDEEDAPPSFGCEHAGVYAPEDLPSPLTRTRRSSSDVSVEQLTIAGPSTTGHHDNKLKLPIGRNLSRASLKSITEEEPTAGGVDTVAVQDSDSTGPGSPGTVIHHGTASKSTGPKATDDVSSLKSDDGEIGDADGVSALTEAGVNGDTAGEYYKVVANSANGHSSGIAKSASTPRVAADDSTDGGAATDSVPTIASSLTPDKSIKGRG